MTLRITRVTTGRGDDGTTDMAGGVRLRKDHPAIEALGAVDELNSHLGLLGAADPGASVATLIMTVQQDLFDLGAVLAGGHAGWAGEQRVAWVTDTTADLNADLPPLEEFILPGGGEATARCHVARAVCRRAERRVVALAEVSAPVPVYLNRLSDLLFVLARHIARAQGEPESCWRGVPRGKA